MCLFSYLRGQWQLFREVGYKASCRLKTSRTAHMPGEGVKWGVWKKGKSNSGETNLLSLNCFSFCVDRFNFISKHLILSGFNFLWFLCAESRMPTLYFFLLDTVGVALDTSVPTVLFCSRHGCAKMRQEKDLLPGVQDDMYGPVPHDARGATCKG